ncbi:MAG: serine kinase [Pseudomonadota bacterium]
MSAAETRLHASAIAIEGRGLLIAGRSGAGKTSLALEMMALGADLIADDQVVLGRRDAELTLSPPEPTAGLIELRGIGLVRRPFQSDIPLFLMIDLDHDAESRLPDAAFRDLLGLPVRLIFGPWRPGLAAALTIAMRAGAIEPVDTPPASTCPQPKDRSPQR